MMLSCEQVLQELWAYLDKDIKASDIPDIQKHLELCRSCFSRVDFEKKLREEMRKKTDCDCPSKVVSRIKAILEKF